MQPLLKEFSYSKQNKFDVTNFSVNDAAFALICDAAFALICDNKNAN